MDQAASTLKRYSQSLESAGESERPEEKPFDPHIPVITKPMDSLVSKVHRVGHMILPTPDSIKGKYDPWSQSGNTFQIKHSDPALGSVYGTLSHIDGGEKLHLYSGIPGHIKDAYEIGFEYGDRKGRGYPTTEYDSVYAHNPFLFMGMHDGMHARPIGHSIGLGPEHFEEQLEPWDRLNDHMDDEINAAISPPSSNKKTNLYNLSRVYKKIQFHHGVRGAMASEVLAQAMSNLWDHYLTQNPRAQKTDLKNLTSKLVDAINKHPMDQESLHEELNNHFPFSRTESPPYYSYEGKYFYPTEGYDHNDVRRAHADYLLALAAMNGMEEARNYRLSKMASPEKKARRLLNLLRKRRVGDLLRKAMVSYEHLHPDFHPTFGIAPRLGNFLHQLSVGEYPEVAQAAERVLREGPNGLPDLHRLMKIVQHPKANEFDLTHAPRAIEIDRKVKDELENGQKRFGREDRPASMTPDEMVMQMLFPAMRQKLPKGRLLNVVRQVVPDANSRDLVHALLRLKGNDPRVGHHFSILPSQLAQNVRKKENYGMAKLGAIPMNVHGYPRTTPSPTDPPALATAPGGSQTIVGETSNKLSDSQPTVNLRAPALKKNRVVKTLQRAGKPVKKSLDAERSAPALAKAVQEDPHDHGARGALADALEESGQHHDPETLDHLRNYEHPAYGFQHPASGKWVFSPNRKWLIGEFLHHHWHNGLLKQNLTHPDAYTRTGDWNAHEFDNSATEGLLGHSPQSAKTIASLLEGLHLQALARFVTQPDSSGVVHLEQMGSSGPLPISLFHNLADGSSQMQIITGSRATERGLQNTPALILNGTFKSNQDRLQGEKEFHSLGEDPWAYKSPVWQTPESESDFLTFKTPTQMSRRGKPIRKSLDAERAVPGLAQSVQADPHDHDARGVLADALEESGQYHDPETLDHLRNFEHPVYGFQHPASGRWVFSPRRSWLIEQFARAHPGPLDEDSVAIHGFKPQYGNHEQLESFLRAIGLHGHADAFNSGVNQYGENLEDGDQVGYWTRRRSGRPSAVYGKLIAIRTPNGSFTILAGDKDNHPQLDNRARQEHAALAEEDRLHGGELQPTQMSRRLLHLLRKQKAGTERLHSLQARVIYRRNTLLRKLYQQLKANEVRAQNWQKEGFVHDLSHVLNKLQEAAKAKASGGGRHASHFGALDNLISRVRKGDFKELKLISHLLKSLGYSDSSIKISGEDHKLGDWLDHAFTKVGHLNLTGKDPTKGFATAKPELSNVDSKRQQALVPEVSSADPFKAATKVEDPVQIKSFKQSDKINAANRRNRRKAEAGGLMVPAFKAGSLFSGTDLEKFLQRVYHRTSQEFKKISEGHQRNEAASGEEHNKYPAPHQLPYMNNFRKSIQELMDRQAGHFIDYLKENHFFDKIETMKGKKIGIPALGPIRKPGSGDYYDFVKPMDRYYNLDTLAPHMALDQEIHKILSDKKFDWKKLKAYIAQGAGDGNSYHTGIDLGGRGLPLPHNDHRNYEAVHRWLSHDKPKSYTDNWGEPSDPAKKRFAEYLGGLIDPKVHHLFANNDKLKGEGVSYRKVAESIGRVAKHLSEKKQRQVAEEGQPEIGYIPKEYPKGHPYKMSRRSVKPLQRYGRPYEGEHAAMVEPLFADPSNPAGRAMVADFLHEDNHPLADLVGHGEHLGDWSNYRNLWDQKGWYGANFLGNFPVQHGFVDLWQNPTNSNTYHVVGSLDHNQHDGIYYHHQMSKQELTDFLKKSLAHARNLITVPPNAPSSAIRLKDPLPESSLTNHDDTVKQHLATMQRVHSHLQNLEVPFHDYAHYFRPDPEPEGKIENPENSV